MKVGTLFRKLSYGELRNQPGGGSGSGLVDESRIPELVTYANEGLVRLYSRFSLSEKLLVIQLIQGKTEYRLHRRFAKYGYKGTSGAPVQYILDTKCAPFTGDLIRVLEAYDPAGRMLHLNDEGDPRSIFTPKVDVIQVPNPVQGGILSLTYQAAHKPLCEENVNGVQPVLDQEIDLPFVLEKALQKFVASEYFGSLGSEDGEAKQAKLLASVEGICSEVESKDLVNQTWATNHSKLLERGFV